MHLSWCYGSTWMVQKEKKRRLIQYLMSDVSLWDHTMVNFHSAKLSSCSATVKNFKLTITFYISYFNFMHTLYPIRSFHSVKPNSDTQTQCQTSGVHMLHFWKGDTTKWNCKCSTFWNTLCLFILFTEGQIQWIIFHRQFWYIIDHLSLQNNHCAGK